MTDFSVQIDRMYKYGFEKLDQTYPVNESTVKLRLALLKEMIMHNLDSKLEVALDEITANPEFQSNLLIFSIGINMKTKQDFKQLLLDNINIGGKITIVLIDPYFNKETLLFNLGSLFNTTDLKVIPTSEHLDSFTLPSIELTFICIKKQVLGGRSKEFLYDHPLYNVKIESFKKLIQTYNTKKTPIVFIDSVSFWKHPSGLTEVGFFGVNADYIYFPLCQSVDKSLLYFKYSFYPNNNSYSIMTLLNNNITYDFSKDNKVKNLEFNSYIIDKVEDKLKFIWKGVCINNFKSYLPISEFKIKECSGEY